MKKFTSAAVLVAMITAMISLMCCHAFAASETVCDTIPTSSSEVQKCINAADDAVPYIIRINKEIIVTGSSINVPAGKNIIIRSESKKGVLSTTYGSFRRNSSLTDKALFTVASGATLTFRNANTDKDFEILGSQTSSVIKSTMPAIHTKGTVVFEKNCLLRRCFLDSETATGAGILVNGGKLIVSGSTISNCTSYSSAGGAISVINGGSAELNSVTIKSCSAIKGSSIYYSTGSLTLGGETSFDNIVYAAKSIILKSDFSSETPIKLTFPNYTINREVLNFSEGFDYDGLFTTVGTG